MPPDGTLAPSSLSAAAPRAARPRIELCDALRGSALCGILVLHASSHFNLRFEPPHYPPWLQNLDRFTLTALDFLFLGKAYAVFAFLFGLNFWFLLKNWSLRDPHPHRRFVWRLTVLAAIG